MSNTNAEYLKCKFIIVLDEANTEVRLVTQTTPKRESFTYLVSVILKSVDINDDVAHRIGATRVK